MHPIEHLLYYTCMLIHWVVASHPIHMMMNGQHATFAAILGHGGFEDFVIKDGVKVKSGASYYHSLHHRYFECNYGEMGMPSITGSAPATMAHRKRASGCWRGSGRCTGVNRPHPPTPSPKMREGER